MGAKLTLEGSSTGAVKAIDDLRKAIDAVDKGLVTSGKSAAQLEKAAQNISKNNEAPQAKYNRRLIEMADAVNKGKLSLADAEHAAAKYGVQLEHAGKKGHESMAGTVAEIAKGVAGMLSLEKATEFVTEALKEQYAEKLKAAENVTAGLSGAGELANVSPSPEAYQHNVGLARRIMEKGILPRDQQDAALYAAAGMAAAELTPGQEDFMIELGRQKRVPGGQLGEFSTAVHSFIEAYHLDPKKDFERISKELLQAGADTLGKSTPMDIAKQLADLAPDARKTKLTPDQDIAAFAVIQRTAKSAKSAAAHEKEFFKAGGKFTDKDLSERYEQESEKLVKAGQSPVPDYVATDPEYGTARGTEEAEAEEQGEFEKHTAQATSLYHRLHIANRKNIRKDYGWGLAGGAAVAVDKTIEAMGATLSQEESALQGAVDSPLSEGKYGAAFIEEIKEHLKRNNELLEEQNTIMREKSTAPPRPSGPQE